MSIESITIEQFQSHKKTVLELSKGLNVIWGPSDNGKSSIIRGIKWVVLNRPSGDEFRRHNTKNTTVTIKSDNSIIQRIRTDTKNEYKIENTIFKALKSAVPEEVSSKLNISEINIQSQHEVYFLVDKSPGQRSKILNEVAGLEIMDKVLKKTNTDIRSINADIKATNKQILEDQTNILYFDWVTKADKTLKKLEAYQKEIENKELFHEDICDIIAEIEEYEEIKSEFMSDKCITIIEALSKEEKEIEFVCSEYERIQKTIDQVESLEKYCDSINVIDVSPLEKLQDKIDFLVIKYDRVSQNIKEIKSKEDQYKRQNEAIEKTECMFLAELKKYGECPTCGCKL